MQKIISDAIQEITETSKAYILQNFKTCGFPCQVEVDDHIDPDGITVPSWASLNETTILRTRNEISISDSPTQNDSSR